MCGMDCKTSQAWNEKVKVKLLSRVRLFATPWTVAFQVPPSMEFSRQDYWSGLPYPPPGDLPYPGIEPGLLHYKQMLYHLRHQGSQAWKVRAIQRLGGWHWRLVWRTVVRMDGLFLDGKSIRLTNQWDARAEVPQDFRHLYVITIFKKISAEGAAAMKVKDIHFLEEELWPT